MCSNSPQSRERIGVGGIKLSRPLAQFHLHRPAQDPFFLASAIETIAGRQIDVAYLTISSVSGAIDASLCVAAKQMTDVHHILGSSAEQPVQLQSLSQAGTVTLFPHKNSLALLGRTLRCCGTRGLPLSGLCTSISALSFTTSHPALDDCIAALETVVELPANHAPFRPDAILVNMVETVAVYWEPVIRIYGFGIREDVALLTLTLRPEALEHVGGQLEELAAAGPGFIMALLQTTGDGSFRCSLALEREFARKCQRQLEDCVKTRYTISIELAQPVEVLFFHGPHFQDRYGIAAAIFRALGQQRIELRALACTGTSIYLVVGAGEAELARQMLSAEFATP